jgi:hypothetical protein
MHIFETRNRLVEDYKPCIKSFINIHDERISEFVHTSLNASVL